MSIFLVSDCLTRWREKRVDYLVRCHRCCRSCENRQIIEASSGRVAPHHLGQLHLQSGASGEADLVANWQLWWERIWGIFIVDCCLPRLGKGCEDWRVSWQLHPIWIENTLQRIQHWGILYIRDTLQSKQYWVKCKESWQLSATRLLFHVQSVFSTVTKHGGPGVIIVIIQILRGALRRNFSGNFKYLELKVAQT